jgi:hypothetical protein
MARPLLRLTTWTFTEPHPDSGAKPFPKIFEPQTAPHPWPSQISFAVTFSQLAILPVELWEPRSLLSRSLGKQIYLKQP